jgi:hypothetical protein
MADGLNRGAVYVAAGRQEKLRWFASFFEVRQLGSRLQLYTHSPLPLWVGQVYYPGTSGLAHQGGSDHFPDPQVCRPKAFERDSISRFVAIVPTMNESCERL